MPDITQNVIIEFISDTSQLQPGVDKLVETGKVEKGVGEEFKKTNAEILKQQKALESIGAITKKIDETGKVTKTNLRDLAKIIKGQSESFQKEIKSGIIDALKQAGVSVKQFEKLLDDSLDPEPVITLKAQLRQMVEQLAQLKVQGKDTGQEYLDLAIKAGKLRDAIGDANQQVKNFGSDTSTFDGLIQGVSGLAGGFAVVQGAAALFGDESEELQKTLLRVNAAMAILQGLQQIQVVLQKESAASQLLGTIATKAQAAALVVYNFVVGSSIGLMKAFRIALAATGVGLLILAVIELANAFKGSNKELEDANALIDTQKRLIDGLNESIQRSTDLEVARLQSSGAAQSAVTAAQGRALLRQREGLIQTEKRLIRQRDEIGRTSKAWHELNNAIEENTNAIKGLDNDLVIKNIQYEAQLAEERKEAAKKREDDAKKFAEDQKRRREEALQKEKEARAAGFADFKASVELELLASEKGSQEELEIKKRLLRAELQQALDNDKLTENQRKLSIQKFFSDRLELEKQFNKDRDKITFENIASGIQADLAALEISTADKLKLTETGLKLQAQLEIAAAEGNVAKIVEIEARRDKLIRDAKIASIQEAVDYEIALAEASNGPGKRRLQAALENGELEVEDRKAIVNELAILDNAAIQKRIDALNEQRKQGLISQKDYDLQYAQLVDKQTQIWEDAEKKKTEISKAEGQKRAEQFKKDLDNILAVANLVGDILGGLADIQAQQENEKLAADRQRIKELEDAGAISEKDATRRLKRIDAEERKIKREQARREKELALFQAIISTAKGVASAIPNPFLIALAIAIGAAQIAIIASRPLPKFAKGKKGSYEGLGLVGEAGSELIEKGGRMFVAEKPEIVWLGKSDKVYSHKETVEMMSKPAMSTERNTQPGKSGKGIEFDYDKMGKAVADNVQTNVFVDGVQEQTIRKREFIKYLDSKRNL